MNKECRLTNATGMVVAVGARDRMLSFLKHHSPDGAFAVVGPGIDAKFYRSGGVVYPAGGQIDHQAIPARTLDECVAAFGLAAELNNTGVGLIDDDLFMKELEGMGDDTPCPRHAPDATKSLLLDRLRAAGVSTVAVWYDGYDDSGCVEDVAVLGPDGAAVQLSPDLLASLEEYVYDRLPGGWENNDGSYGQVEIDVAAGTVTFDHGRRYTEVAHEEWED